MELKTVPITGNSFIVCMNRFYVKRREAFGECCAVHDEI